MKKIFALFLILAMVIMMLTGCTGGNSQANNNEDSNNSSDNSNDIASLTIKFSATTTENETGGVILSYFADRVKELSNGAMDVQIYWGGTLFPSSDELDAVIDGSVDMIALGHMPHLNTVTYLGFPAFVPGGSQGAIDLFRYLMFEDSETSTLIQGEASDLGIKYLNVIAGGANAFCSKNEFSDIDDLASKSSAFGNFDVAVFTSLGFQVTVLPPPDIYDALNRGLIDATQMALAPMTALSWYEPAPYFSLDGTYTAGNFYTVNLEWWDSLTDAQRDVIEKAALETEAESIRIYDKAIEADIATIEKATGNKVLALSDSDVNKVWKSVFDAKAETALEIAENAGKKDGMITIFEKSAEFTEYDWKH